MSQIGSEPTAKMNYDQPRRFLNPLPAVSRKRKERESVLQFKPTPPPPTAPLPSSPCAARADAAKSDVASAKACSNRLLAGYMAHEFLTSGTLFGQKWDPARAEAVPLSGRGSSEKEQSRMVKLSENRQSYADVAKLLMKGEEAHVAGVVNPSQLARWIQM